MTKRLRDYTLVIRPDDNGTFVACVLGIDGCQAWGRTLDEARSELDNVFEMIAEEYERSGKIFPPDVRLTITPLG